MFIYFLKSSLSDKIYIGVTNNLQRRWNSHRHFAKFKKSKLYDHIRKYGIDTYSIVSLFEMETREDANQLEKILIAGLKPELNLAQGGEGGFNVVNIDEWKEKLRKARKGRKPSLGMKHSVETKELLRQQQIKRHELN